MAGLAIDVVDAPRRRGRSRRYKDADAKAIHETFGKLKDGQVVAFDGPQAKDTSARYLARLMLNAMESAGLKVNEMAATRVVVPATDDKPEMYRPALRKVIA